MVAKILESGISTFINILVKLCIYPYIVNHVIWIALFGIQESLESSQESWNQARNLGILPRFQKIPNHVEENSVSGPSEVSMQYDFKEQQIQFTGCVCVCACVRACVCGI